MEETVIITGGSGLLAINWAISIRDRYRVVLLLHDRIISVQGVEVSISSLDSVESVNRVLKEYQPALVVHAAGLTNVELCEREPEIAYKINVNLAENMAQSCAEHEVPFVHISTDHLFSGETELVDETCEKRPINIYAKTKSIAEDRVMATNDNALIVRTNFYGWGTSYRKSFSDMIVDSLRAGRGITLYQDIYFTPIIIQELVRAVHDLVHLGERGIVHVVGDDRISKYQFGIKLVEIFKLDRTLVRLGESVGNALFTNRPKDMSLSNQKAEHILGRKIGGIDAHLNILLEQEKRGMSEQVEKI